MPFDTLPHKATLKPQPYKVEVSDSDLNDFRQLVKLSKIGPKTYENLRTNVKDYEDWGISRAWLEEAKKEWETSYNWRNTEARINSFPNYIVDIDDGEGYTYHVQFIALYSKNADAAPMLMSHGWPGSILEFLDALDILRKKYNEESLPFHCIVPSLPGYGFTSGPPLDKNSTIESMSKVLDRLMVGLGFKDGYIAQGGDIGSFISRVLGVTSDSCKAVHLNLCVGATEPKEGPATASLSEVKQKAVKRCNEFATLGNAYAREHGTRPATVGLVLSSSPVALLAWVGEKFLQWTDTSPSNQEILDSATLYWFTESFPRAIFPYRQFFGPEPSFFHNDPNLYIKKYMGYSFRPQELSPVPPEWAATTGNLVFIREHGSGGHFAAMEQPKEYVQEMEEFVQEVWPKAK